jgi:hypothetical protein
MEINPKDKEKEMNDEQLELDLEQEDEFADTWYDLGRRN